MRSLWDTIDEIREKPEGIRRRYMFGYVAVTMFLVLGIWLISLRESLDSVGKMGADAERIKNQAAQQVLPGPAGARSLSDLLKDDEQLNAGNPAVSAEDFFGSEIRAKEEKKSGEQNSPDAGK